MKKYDSTLKKVVEMTQEEIDEFNNNQEIEIEETLEEKVQRLEEQNQMLTDCILEMADILYA